MTRKTKPTAGKNFRTRTLTLLRYSKRTNYWESKSTIPVVTLAGKWMYEAGFRSGQKIRIIVQQGELIIRIESDPQTTGKQPLIEWERKRTSWTQPPELHSESFTKRKVQRVKRKQRRKHGILNE